MGKKKRIWLRKWDYNKYPFERLIFDYKNEKIDGLGVNYGRKFEKKEDIKDGSLIKNGDDIYIYFINVPGLENQIMLKYENVQVTDKNGNLYFDRIELNNMKKEDIKYQKYCTVNNKNDIKWVVDKNNRFSKEGLLNEFGISDKFYTSIDITGTPLAKALEDSNCYANISEYARKYENICYCFFIKNKLEGYYEKSHETFTKKDGLPYIERHHFIPQEVYRNADESLKEKLYLKIYSRENILFLCPRCHRMIHLGQSDRQDEMINRIMKEDNIRKNVEDIASILNITADELLKRCYKD